ncbi:MAG: prepilin-type N-terminal cleavage/methylation domain-containing protein [Candidatus Omnitrophota bacterium]
MSKGYTLVEVMVVMFILAVLAGGIFMVMSSGRQSWDISEARTALQLELRKALLRISDDLKQSSMNRTFIDPGLTTNFPTGVVYPAIYFKVPQGISNATGAVVWNSSSVSYALVNNTVTRADGAGTLNIASNITGMNFTRIANDVFQIRLSGQKIKAVEHGNATINATLDSAVAVRNN